MTESLGRRRLGEYRKYLPNQPSRKLPDWCLKEAGFDDNIRGYAPALVNHVPIVVPKTALSKLLHKVIYGEETPDQEDVVTDDDDSDSDSSSGSVSVSGSSSASGGSYNTVVYTPRKGEKPGHGSDDSSDREARSDSGSFTGDVSDIANLEDFKDEMPELEPEPDLGPLVPVPLSPTAEGPMSLAPETVPETGKVSLTMTSDELATKIASLEGVSFKLARVPKQ